MHIPGPGQSMSHADDNKLDRHSDSGSISSTLLEQVRSHRADAWTRLADLYGPVVYRWCRRANVARDDAADLVQEVFAAVSRHIADFRRDRPGDSFAAWLRTITCNTIRDFFRTRRRTPVARGGTDAQQQLLQVPDQAELSQASDPREVNSLVVPIGMELVRSEFENNTWEAFRRSVIEKQPASRIALELGISIPAVYQAKSRVLRRLRRELDGLLD
jgi:RNA polymerase sigma-70 factor, ECF subfamily